jgi:hypothetical protein
VLVIQCFAPCQCLQAILNMRACLEDCYAELEQQLQQIECGWDDFLWAVQVRNSSSSNSSNSVSGSSRSVSRANGSSNSTWPADMSCFLPVPAVLLTLPAAAAAGVPCAACSASSMHLCIAHLPYLWLACLVAYLLACLSAACPCALCLPADWYAACPVRCFTAAASLSPPHSSTWQVGAAAQPGSDPHTVVQAVQSSS